MLKKHVFALFILLGSAAVVTAQAQENTEEGIVVLKIYDPTTTAIVTDARGQFVFTHYDLKGQAARTLWKLDKTENEWSQVKNHTTAESGDLILVAGKTDLNDVPPGSMVQAVYWEDASGTNWCLANPGTTLIDPVPLKLLQSGTPPVLDMKNNTEHSGWVGKFPIRMQYK